MRGKFIKFHIGEANHRKYKRLKIGGGQAYDRSSVSAAVVAKATRSRA
jgi:hypothetical protein